MIVASFFRDERGGADALAATGADGLRRVLDVYTGHAATPRAWREALPDGAAQSDTWWAAIAVLARAAPAAYLDSLGGRRLDVRDLAVLGDVDDPRATSVLAEYAQDPDWLRRNAAVASLGRRGDDVARRCVEQALEDPEVVVRLTATDCVAAREPARAAPLYERLLMDAAATPAVVAAATIALRALAR